jgi:4-amino-4-deoxy-L-arabinose transferase-like glycosyltransferase
VPRAGGSGQARLRSSSAVGAALLLVAAILYAWRLGTNPIYPYDAEVLFGLHAHAIAMTGHDFNGRLLPLYFQMPAIGENVWFHPAIVYFTAPFLRVLPFAEWSVRLPSVVLGLVNLVLMWFIARRIFASERWAFLASILLALTPSHFIHSRVAMDYLYPVPFVMAWLLCLLAFLDRGRPVLLFLATSFLGVGFYSYIASVVMMPVYLAVTAVTLWVTSNRSPRIFMTALAGFVWPLLLLSWVAFHPEVFGQTLARYGVGGPDPGIPRGPRPIAEILEALRKPVRFSELTGRLSLYWYFFDPSYLFVTGGYANVVNSTRHVGVFVLPFLLFVPVGLYRMAVSRRLTDLLILFGFLSAPFAACLVVPEPYAIDRELALLPFGVLIAAAGVRALVDARHTLVRAIGVAALIVVPLHFAFFVYDYYGDYRLRSAFWFEWNHRDAFALAIARAREDAAPAIYLSTDQMPYMDAYWRFYLIKERAEPLLDRTVYFDAHAVDLQAIPAKSVLVVGPRDAEALSSSTHVRRIALVPEPADPPFFSVWQR